MANEPCNQRSRRGIVVAAPGHDLVRPDERQVRRIEVARFLVVQVEDLEAEAGLLRRRYEPCCAVPRKAKQEGPYVAFSVEGTLDLALTGVLSRILVPLAEAEVPVFTLATFDTDWVLVPVGQAERATEVWRGAGLAVRPALEPEGTAR